MNWAVLAPQIVGAIFIVTVGGVILLRPITTRLGALVEAMAQEKQARSSDEVHRLREEVETLRSRMELLEDRQDFTEALIGPGPSRKVGELEE